MENSSILMIYLLMIYLINFSRAESKSKLEVSKEDLQRELTEM